MIVTVLQFNRCSIRSDAPLRSTKAFRLAGCNTAPLSEATDKAFVVPVTFFALGETVVRRKYTAF